MKKILYTVCLMLFMGAFASEVDFSQMLNSTTMPTDAEIRAVISQFNFDKDTQEVLFKDTKKKLKQMYSQKDKQSVNQELNSSLDMLKSSEIDEYVSPQLKQEVLKEVDSLPKVEPTSQSLPEDAEPGSSTSTTKFEKGKYAPKREK